MPTITKGPGSYELPKYKSRAANFAKYSERQNKIETYDVPLYQHCEKKIKGSIIGKANRLTAKINVSPGPGYSLQHIISQYSISSSHNAIGGVFLSSRKESRTDVTPGPIYNCRSQLGKSAVKYVHEFTTRRRLPDPGPGSYTIDLNQSSSVSIGRQKRKWSYIKDNNVPGPGSYTEREKKVQKRIISVTQHRKQHTQIDPEFASPESLMKFKLFGQLKVSFPKQVRKNEFLDPLNAPTNDMRSPGPALYASTTTRISKGLPKFGMAKRPEAFKPKEGPGVGSYSKLAQFGKDYTIKSKKQTIIYNFSDFEVI